MLLKRKRSTTTLSSHSSDPSTNTVQSFYPHTKPLPSPLLDLKPALTSSDLNTRTRKRHRDNRPEASTIHGACNNSSSNSSSAPSPCWLGAVIKMSALADVCRVAACTIQRLYDAQRAANNSLPPNEELQQQQQQQPTMTQKSTLHSFWHISQPPPPPTAQAPQQQRGFCSDEPRCEDCDGGLRGEDAMEVDEMAGEDKACASCRRRVCDGCAVWGSERVCRGCAGGRA